MPEWKDGPPVDAGMDEEFVVESETGNVFRVRPGDNEEYFKAIISRGRYVTVEAKNIVRHFTYKPPPTPTPLKPFRRFNCVNTHGVHGTGDFNPNTYESFSYRIYWGKGPTTHIYKNLDGFEIDWIDDA